MSGAIEFACPYCERVTRVPAEFAGKQGKCPKCQKVIEVPDPRALGAAAPTVPSPPPLPAIDVPHAAVGGPVGAPIGGPVGAPIGGPVGAAPAAAAGPTRPCPFCGEHILAAAKKCKFCGEFLDAGARAAARQGGAGGGLPADMHLASRLSRFAARLLDGLIEMPGPILAVVGGVLLAIELDPSVPPANKPGVPPAVSGLMLGVGGLLALGTIAYQWYLIASRGQTIAKRWLGIKIVRLDGSDVDFVTGVILRNWVVNLLGALPYIGACVSFVDPLLIFGEEQRCLHDQIASTRVVEA